MSGPSTAASRRRLAGLLIGGAALGKVLGLVREITLARMLGATMIVDGFRGALTAVWLPLAPLQGDVVPAVLIPLQRRWYEEGDGARHAAALCALFTLIASALAVVVSLLADQWVRLVVGGFSEQGLELTRHFVQVMAVAMPASALFNSLSAVEISLGRSRITSVRSSVQNVGVILGVIITYLTGNPIAIGWCFSAAFGVTALWGAWVLWREGQLDLSGIRVGLMARVFMAFVGRVRHLIAQPLADQGLIWLERVFGSLAGVGTVAALDYARTLSESATLLVSQPVGYAVLSGVETAPDDMADRVDSIARPLLAMALPLSAFLIMFAPDLVHIAFGRGAFTAHAELMTTRTLQGNSAALWATMLGWILVRLLNVAGRNGRAATIFVAAYAVNALLLLASMSMHAADGAASLALGAGESLRGLILLFGTAMALGCTRQVLMLTLKAMPAAAACLLLGDAVRSLIESSLLRLAAGGTIWMCASAVTIAVLMPRQTSEVCQKLYAIFGFKSRPPNQYDVDAVS